MPVQPRAEATRQEIIDAAVELFTTHGYANITIADIISKAITTKGAFYYHFPSKADIVEAIHEIGQQQFLDARLALFAVPMRSMERLIRGTFLVAELVTTNKFVRVSSQLRQALTHVTESVEVRRAHEGNLLFVLEFIAGAVTEGDLRPGVDEGALLTAINSGVLGVLLAADTGGGCPFAGLANMWRVLIPGVVADDSEEFFQRLIDFLESHYRES